MSDNHVRTGSGFATRAVHVGNEVGRDSGAIFGPAGEVNQCGLSPNHAGAGAGAAETSYSRGIRRDSHVTN